MIYYRIYLYIKNMSSCIILYYIILYIILYYRVKVRGISLGARDITDPPWRETSHQKKQEPFSSYLRLDHKTFHFSSKKKTSMD